MKSDPILCPTFVPKCQISIDGSRWISLFVRTHWITKFSIESEMTSLFIIAISIPVEKKILSSEVFFLSFVRSLSHFWHWDANRFIRSVNRWRVTVVCSSHSLWQTAIQTLSLSFYSSLAAVRFRLILLNVVSCFVISQAKIQRTTGDEGERGREKRDRAESKKNAQKIIAA